MGPRIRAALREPAPFRTSLFAASIYRSIARKASDAETLIQIKNGVSWGGGMLRSRFFFAAPVISGSDLDRTRWMKQT
jgi:hypothetical protein